MLRAGPGQEAKLTIIGASEVSVSVRVLEVDGRRITVWSETPLQPGAPVRLTSGEYVVLAEVVSHSTDNVSDSRFLLQVRHCLPAADLEQIARWWT